MEKKVRKEHGKDEMQTLTGKMPRTAPEQTVAWIPASKLSIEIRRGMTGNASEPTDHTASH